MAWFIVLLLVLGGGFYGYYKFKEIERQIRDEQAQEKQETQQGQQKQSGQDSSTSGDSHVSAPKSAVENEASPVTRVEKQQAGGTSADEPSAAPAGEPAILRAVQSQPGIVQSDLYTQFPAANKKQLQQQIKKMSDEGNIKRESYRSSYRLYPA